MGEHIYRIELADLKTLRVRCVKCGTVTELPVDQAGRIKSRCPHCDEDLCSEHVDLFRQLQVLMGKLGTLTTVEIEFPIRLDAKE